MVLCVRSDDPQGRHYDGRLAYLGLYDVALNETQVGWVGGLLGWVREHREGSDGEGGAGGGVSLGRSPWVFHETTLETGMQAILQAGPRAGRLSTHPPPDPLCATLAAAPAACCTARSPTRLRQLRHLPRPLGSCQSWLRLEVMRWQRRAA